MSLLRSSAVIGAFTGLSRILGFAREILLAGILGAGPISDAFFIAFRLPNLFRRVLAEGAFNSAFVPLYTRTMEGDGQEAATRFATETYRALFAVLIALVLAFQVGMPFVIMGLAPGYAGDWDWIWRTTVLGLLTMPYIAFMSLTAMFGGVLNAHKRFAAFAFAPVLLNVVLIAVLLSPIGQGWQAARWLAGGVFIAGALQCGVVAWGLSRQGIRLSLGLPRITPGVKRVAALGAPGVLAAGVTQINIVISQMIASTQEGAVSWLSYADRLYQLPLGMIGIAMGVALLPTLSREMKAGGEAAGRDTLNRALEISAFFTLPATAALAAASSFWITAIYERGAFTSADTQTTAPLVFAFACGLPAFIAVKVLSPGFFAREDTKTPMRYAAITVGVNIALGFLLFWRIGVVGLALATSIAAWVNAGLLAVTLARHGVFRADARLAGRLPRIAVASIALGAGVWYGAGVLDEMLGRNLALDVGLAGGLGLAGLAVYGVLCLLIGAIRPSELTGIVRARA